MQCFDFSKFYFLLTFPFAGIILRLCVLDLNNAPHNNNNNNNSMLQIALWNYFRFPFTTIAVAYIHTRNIYHAGTHTPASFSKIKRKKRFSLSFFIFFFAFSWFYLWSPIVPDKQYKTNCNNVSVRVRVCVYITYNFFFESGMSFKCIGYLATVYGMFRWHDMLLACKCIS